MRDATKRQFGLRELLLATAGIGLFCLEARLIGWFVATAVSLLCLSIIVVALLWRNQLRIGQGVILFVSATILLFVVCCMLP